MSRFNLPVLKGVREATAQEILRMARHGEGIFWAAAGEEVELEFGVAMVGGRRMRDVERIEGMTAEQMVEAAEGVFATKGAECRRWEFVGGGVDAEVREVLEGKGFRVRRGHLWGMKEYRALEGREDLTVIPGRAAMGKLAELAEARGRGMGEVAVRVLDEAVVDCLVALNGTEAVGALYLVTSGEMGVIADFFVHPGHLRRGVGRTLLERGIELAGRARLKRLCLFCDAENMAGRSLIAKAGFAEVMAVEWMERL